MARIYETRQGDTFDIIAFRVYGSEQRAMDIAQANPVHMSTVFFRAGVALILPEIAVEYADLPSPPWRRR